MLTLEFGDESENPRFQALEVMKTLIRIRSKLTLEKMLKFANEVVENAKKMSKYYANQNDDSCNATQVTEFELRNIMIKKEGVLSILGALSSILLHAEDGQYEEMIEKIMELHVVPELNSLFSFMRARACKMIFTFYKLEYSDVNIYKLIAAGCVQCLLHNELPVKMQATQTISRIVVNHQC